MAGEATVYGIAYWHDQPIVGFDAARLTHAHVRGYDLIVPSIDTAESEKRLEVPAAVESFLGMNLNLDEMDGVIGLQPIFTSEEAGHQWRYGDWIGHPTQQPIMVVSETRPVFGIVSFKRQLKTVGIGLIVGNAKDSTK